MRARCISKYEFDKPWRALAVDSDCVYLAGGRNPARGRRSDYSRSVAKFDNRNGQFVWESEQSGSKPYTTIAITDGNIGLVLSSNFSHVPFGLFFFDKTGKLLSQDSYVGVKYMVALADGVFVSIYMHDGAIGFIERDKDGKIEQFPLFDREFDLCGCNKIADGLVVTVSQSSSPDRFEHVFFGPDKRQRWHVCSPLRQVTVTQEAIVLYGDTEKGRTKLEFLDFASGMQIHSAQISSPVWSPVWISPTVLVTQSNQSELSLVNLDDQTVQKVPFDARIAFFDLAYCRTRNQLTVLGSSNPMSSYSAIELLEIG